MSFSKRLKQVIDKKGISQTEAARLCGIAQQSMYYILKNDLKSSKLAPQIAEALDINPEWLILGEGRPDIVKTYEIPIIHSAYMLKKYLNDDLSYDAMDFTIIDQNLGVKAFSYLLTPTKMAICSDSLEKIKANQFLILTEKSEVIITENSGEGRLVFPIFEWRERYEDF